MNLLEFEQLMTGANMPRCLQRGALFDQQPSSSHLLTNLKGQKRALISRKDVTNTRKTLDANIYAGGRERHLATLTLVGC